MVTRERNKQMWTDMPARLITGVLLVLLALSVVIIGGGVLLAGLLVVIFLAGRELCVMLHLDDLTVPVLAGFFLLAAAFHQPALILVVGAGWLLIGWILNHHPLHQAHVTPLVGAVYIGLPLGMLAGVRGMDQGLAWIIFLFSVVWTADSMALVGGRLFGRHRLAPAISPGKTIEGTLTGAVFAVPVGLLVASVLALPLATAVVAAGPLVALSVLGDLLESVIKRLCNVKDSGHLLPGHGGVLDRLDGILLAVPGLYMILVVM
jgi:phosphatidate cytidylyltransferase